MTTEYQVLPTTRRYELLKYKKVKPKKYIGRIDKKWCKLNTAFTRKMDNDYKTTWNLMQHSTAFGKHLVKEQKAQEGE